MGEFSFPPALHLKRPSEFRTVLDRGVKRHTGGFILFRADNRSEQPRLGISISRKVGGAVVRNRVKRLVREAFRLNWRAWGLAGTDLVVIAKRGAASLSFHDVSREFSASLPSRDRR
jgi:ribonuclease P protein component